MSISDLKNDDYDRGFMEARDDMESVLEIVHLCLKQDRALYAQLIIEHYINYIENDDALEENNNDFAKAWKHDRYYGGEQQ